MTDRYQIKEKIGQGGLGEVFLAIDTQLQREVALKRVRAGDGHSPDDVLREAKVLSSLQHPNILTVFDVGQDQAGPFVITELLRGETLEQVVARGALPYPEFRLMVIQTLEALVAAQAMNLIHRDLKPGNLMFVRHASGRFQVKVLDFGLAKFSRKASRQTEDQQSGIMGSIHFMAPEQFERLPLDGRTDLYALGCIYYFALSGRHPFEGETAPVVMASHLAHHVVALGQYRPDLPPWACDWVMWLISRHPADRPTSAQEALDTFQRQSQAWEAALQAAPLAAAAVAASAVTTATTSLPPAFRQAAAAAAATARVAGPVTGRPAGGMTARSSERPAAVERPKPGKTGDTGKTGRSGKEGKTIPVWWYAVPTLVTMGLLYGWWRSRDGAGAASGAGARPGSALTVEDLALPEVEEAALVNGLVVGEGSTPLSIDQARIIGSKARRRASIKAIGYWSSPDTRVVWEIFVSKPGDYEVLVTQSVEDDKMGGKYEVSLAGVTVAGASQRTATKEQFAEVVVGTLTVAKKGPARLEMRPTEVIGTSLMNLGGVTLRRK